MACSVVNTTATTKEVIPTATGCNALAEGSNQELHGASSHRNERFSIFQPMCSLLQTTPKIEFRHGFPSHHTA
jgi:hypothetical protein